MLYKERMRRALEFELVDRLPTQINYTAAMGKILASYFGFGIDEQDKFILEYVRHKFITTIKHG